VAVSLSNRAILYDTQGEYAKAAALYLRSLKIGDNCPANELYCIRSKAVITSTSGGELEHSSFSLAPISLPFQSYQRLNALIAISARIVPFAARKRAFPHR